jgi:hypothetical protein
MRTCAGYPPDRCPGQTVTLPVELAAVPATRTFRPGVSPALPFPHAAEDGPVSTRPVGVGVGGKEHGASLYRGTARQLIHRRPAQRGAGLTFAGPAFAGLAFRGR